MTYLQKLSQKLGLALGEEAPELEEEYNPLELIKLDSRFVQAGTMLVKTVKHYDQSFPDIGADEILAALIDYAIEELKLVNKL